METEERSTKLEVESVRKCNTDVFDSTKELINLTVNDSIDEENTLLEDQLHDIMSKI
jgi:hypothetical protein